MQNRKFEVKCFDLCFKCFAQLCCWVNCFDKFACKSFAKLFTREQLKAREWCSILKNRKSLVNFEEETSFKGVVYNTLLF